MEISNILNEFNDLSNDFRPPGNDMQAFIDLLNDELAARSPTTDHVEGCDLCLDDFDAQLQLLNAGIN